MTRTVRRTLTTATVLACALPATAAAAPNPYTPGQVCGAGYGVVEQRPLRAGDGTLLGSTYLTYSPRTGKNCAVLIKRRAVGTKSYTAVSLKKQGRTAPFVVDFGDFAYYAGPVYVKAPGTCVKFGASMRVPGGRHGVFVSPFGHCG